MMIAIEQLGLVVPVEFRNSRKSKSFQGNEDSN